MEVIILNKDTELVTDKIIPILERKYTEFKEKYDVKEDMSFELYAGTCSEPGKYVYDDEAIENLIARCFQSKVAIISSTQLGGFENSKNYNYFDWSSKEVDRLFTTIVPMFYITNNEYFKMCANSVYSRDMSGSFIVASGFDTIDDHSEVLNRMFTYFLTDDENILGIENRTDYSAETQVKKITKMLSRI